MIDYSLCDAWEYGSLLFDSHAHYDDERFDADRGAVIENALRYCAAIANIGTNLETSRRSIGLAEKYPAFYAAVGIHPHDSQDVGEENEARTLDALRQMLRHEKVRAIGEIGLDFHYDFSPRDVQRRWFELQMRLAEETGLPVVVHDREAHGECVEMARRHPKVKGVFHCFSGSRETAEELVRMGWYISYTGSVTFKNAVRLAETIPAVPDDRLLIETDCPYLAPVPHRSSRNDSAYLRYTAAFIADRRGMELRELAALKAANARRFYGID